MNDNFLDKKLQDRKNANALRSLIVTEHKIDFCSNDYLGIVKSHFIENSLSPQLAHGSTGSRLLSGNYKLIEDTEKFIANFHDADAGLIFNSGYDANIGLLSSIPQKNDAIVYDQLSHASIRDGVRLSFGASFSFLHNDLEDLERKIAHAKNVAQNVFVVTESVFSMDGDFAPLIEIAYVCEKYNAALIVDEAHATGVIGKQGEGVVQHLNIQSKCFARVHTFGKACGAHGAIVLGSAKLRQYLINFARSFIYSTALPPAAVEAIRLSYNIFPEMKEERAHIQHLMNLFKSADLKYRILPSDSPIQIVIIPGNEAVKTIAENLQDNNFDIRAILYPTVPKEQERLRIVMHSFNTTDEVNGVLNVLKSKQ